MMKLNPYRPGAGLMPLYLAGRDTEIENMQQIFYSLKMNIPVQSVIYSGLRGVGKTVLLNRLEEIAQTEGLFGCHIEIEEKSDFISQIVTCSQKFLRRVNKMEKVKEIAAKAIEAIKSLSISFNPTDNTFSFGLSQQEKDLYKSTNLNQTLTDVFTSIGEAAKAAKIPIVFFIDEIQYMKKEELGALISAVHRTNQLGYPVLIVGAGLPKIYKTLSETKSYSERLFSYIEIGSLTKIQSEKAITEPVKGLNVKYTQEAKEKIISATEGYPFFLQQLCKLVYDKADTPIITGEDINSIIPVFYEILDKEFYRVRYSRCSDADKKFIFAMVKCEALPCTISNIASIMGKSVKSISTARAQLISKGIIYASSYGKLDFTVPGFNNFIKRLEEFS